MVPIAPALTRRLGRLDSIEPQMESLQHADQLSLLYECLKQWQVERNAFVGRNMTLLFDPEQLRNRNFLGPDLFAVLDPLPADPSDRSTWVVWEEGYRFPDAIVELLSESTAEGDRGTKKQIYQNTFGTREYFYYAPLKTKKTAYQEFAGFRLVDGEYQPIEPDERGWLWSEVFGMYLGVCRRDLPLSRYREVVNYWDMLRFFTADGEVVLHPEERARLEEMRANREEMRADQAEVERDRERLENERLRALLREAGIEPNRD
ncbi:MAG: Uma2 family endonuclease [Coleofasciculaceae cyanobacterium SM2_3_26]|nr:Uma2 family endonuclease [Coleofasciculaceae cyanobacterium SM2_3_26]